MHQISTVQSREIFWSNRFLSSLRMKSYALHGTYHITSLPSTRVEACWWLEELVILQTIMEDSPSSRCHSRSLMTVWKTVWKLEWIWILQFRILKVWLEQMQIWESLRNKISIQNLLMSWNMMRKRFQRWVDGTWYAC